jgi:hypothetical protein
MDGLHVASIVKHRYDSLRMERTRGEAKEDAGSSGSSVSFRRAIDVG